MIRGGANGLYEISYFGSSVKHSREISKEVYKNLTGRRHSEHTHDWISTSEKKRSAYLLEEHENAHHRLLYSCPLGVLYWRLVQVVQRDIAHLSRVMSKIGANIPENIKPNDYFHSDKLLEYLNSLSEDETPDFSDLQSIIAAIDKIFQLINILFDHNPKEEFSELTIGELLDLLNDVFRWLEDRCHIPRTGPWVSSLPKNEKVFALGREFNCMALLEVHACAHELYLLRAMGDLDGFHERENEFCKDIFGDCFQQLKGDAAYDNEVGFSPHEMQMAVLYALSGRVDPALSADRPIVLEEEFPNFRVTRYSDDQLGLIRSSFETLSNLAEKPLIGPNSKWLSFYRIPEISNLSSVQNFFSTILSLGLDRQIYTIKHGASTNAEFIANKVMHIGGKISNEQWNDEWNIWNQELKLSQILCEYSDNFYFSFVDPEEIYTESHPIWQLEGVQIYFAPQFQFVSSILTGFLPQINVASYFHTYIPTIDVIERKIRRYLEEILTEFYSKSSSEKILELVIGTMRRFYETEEAPFGIKHLRPHPRLTHLI